MKSVEKIIFWDHSVNENYAVEPVLCCVAGEVIQESEVALLIKWWDSYINKNNVNFDDDNHEFCTIIKSTIVSRQVATGWQDK